MPRKGARLKVESGGRHARYCRMRLADPREFDPESFRMKKVKGGVELVVGCPAGKFHRGKCRVGTKAQSMLKRKAGGTCPVFHAPRGQTRVL